MLSLVLPLMFSGCANFKLPAFGTASGNIVAQPKGDIDGDALKANPSESDTERAQHDAASADGETSERTGALEGLRKASVAPSNAMDLTSAWRLALLNDPTYQAALSERAATQTERAQGRAALLPQIQLSYYRARVQGSRYLSDLQGRQTESDLRYDSTNASVQLQQPVFNYARWAEYQRGIAQAEEGAARFEVQKNQVGVRLATVYFRVLLAQGRLELQNALVTSLQSRVETLTSRYQQDHGTRTEVSETRARLAIARADAIDAEDELRVATRELTLIVGRTPDALADLQANFALHPLPSTMEQWLEHALQRSPEIELARKALALARTYVDAATARFLPYADFVASYGRADSDELANLSQQSNTFVVGLNVNIPLFAGGYNSAARSQANARRRHAESQYEATVEKVRAEVIREFTRVDGGEDRIRALEEAEASSVLNVEAANKSFDYGIASNLDVLKAEDTLYRTRHELLNARLEYLIAQVKLAAASDILHESLFNTLNNRFLAGPAALDASAE